MINVTNQCATKLDPTVDPCRYRHDERLGANDYAWLEGASEDAKEVDYCRMKICFTHESCLSRMAGAMEWTGRWYQWVGVKEWVGRPFHREA